MTRTLAGKTILVSGGSRGIGLAIALRAARDGASIVLLAKTATPHPKLEGTIYTAAEQVDTVVNNASAIDLSPTLKISMKRYDLLQDVNARGTFALTRAALPYLEAAANPHILTLSPPLNLNSRWVGTCTGNFYTDEDVLREEGVTDFSGYRLGDREEDLDPDFFLPDAPLPERP